MNKRIKELEAQCWEHDQSWTGVGQQVFNREKFALLIVRECAKVAGGVHGYRHVMEHFGVER